VATRSPVATPGEPVRFAARPILRAHYRRDIAAETVTTAVPEIDARARRRTTIALGSALIGLVCMGFNRQRVADWPVSDLLFLVAAGVMVADVLSGRDGYLAPSRARRGSPSVLVGIVVVLVAGALSSLQSFNPGRSLTVTLRFAWIFLGLFWVIRALARDRETLGRLLTGWRLCILLNALVCISDQLGVTSFGMENAENRQTAFFIEPNEVAGLLVIGLPLFVLGVPRVRAYRTDGRELLARAVPIGLIVYAIATTGSMTALLAGAVGVVVTVFAGGWRHMRRPGHAARSPLVGMTVAFAVVVGMFALLTSDLPVVERFDRFASGDQYVTGSVDTREERNEEVIQRVPESLLVGQGFGSYDRNDPGAEDAAGAHNMYFRFIFQAGMPGLIGVLLIIGFSVQLCLRLLRSTRHSRLHPTAIALTASLVTANTFALFQPTEFHRYYWVTVAFVGALWSLRKEELRATWAERQAEVDAIARIPARSSPRAAREDSPHGPTA
jgi:hypothetical protein